MRTCFVFVFFYCLLAGFSGDAQSRIDGLWRGYNTQEAAGSYSHKYDFEIYIKESNGQVRGRSYAKINGLFAVMELAGEWRDGTLTFREIKILDEKADPGMEWCIKSGVLTLIEAGDTPRLEGTWRGRTSFSDCFPGKIFLKKVIPRA
ncbi:MAG: hypothetical protein D6714_14315 [Bacteroidetes bacterium]|nr:MAG: hypothetical protein D6714_14315 [Bacteroidota bacterium]